MLASSQGKTVLSETTIAMQERTTVFIQQKMQVFFQEKTPPEITTVFIQGKTTVT